MGCIAIELAESKDIKIGFSCHCNIKLTERAGHCSFFRNFVA